MVRKALGRGLDSLLSEEIIPSKHVLLELDVDALEPNRFQPRKDFKETHLKELAESIKIEGVLQPLLVRKTGDSYEIVAGERRWRAAKKAGIKKVPVLVLEADDLKLQKLALIENLQREDLAPLEEAVAYKNLIDKYEFTQAELAEQIGKKRSTIANMLRLLQLPEPIKKDLLAGNITVGHAIAILSVDKPEKQVSFSREIIDSGFSVREAETAARKLKKRAGKKTFLRRSAVNEQLLGILRNHFKTKVEVVYKGRSGKFILDFYSEEDLNRIIFLMGINIDS